MAFEGTLTRHVTSLLLFFLIAISISVPSEARDQIEFLIGAIGAEEPCPSCQLRSHRLGDDRPDERAVAGVFRF